MPEDKELNNDSRTERQANFLGPGQYVEGDNTVNNGDNKCNEAIVQGSDAGETVVNNGGTQTNIGDSIGSVNVANHILCLERDSLRHFMAEGGFAFTDSQSLKAFLSSSASKLPINSDSLERLKKEIANSELDSIATRFKSCAVLADYFAKDERRISLANLMAYGCHHQIINLRGTEHFQDNCKSLADSFCFCLEWIQHYCRHYRPKKIDDEQKEKLQKYSRTALDEGFAFLEFFLRRNHEIIGDSEVKHLRELTQIFYRKIGVK